jgi:hypothetical protein
MRFKTRIALIGLLTTLAVTVVLTIQMIGSRPRSIVTWSRPRSIVTWGGSTLCVSERDYFMAQMNALLEAWIQGKPMQQLGQRRRRREERLLAVDLQHRVIWSEPRGHPWEPKAVSLPAALSWTLYRRIGIEIVRLPSFVCLRSSSAPDGRVVLVGESADNMVLSCRLGRVNAMEWEAGPFDPNSLSEASMIGDNPKMITDESLLQEIAHHRPTESLIYDSNLLSQGDLASDVQYRIAWHALQKPLYQALEQRMKDQGLEVARIAAYPGPDYTAGVAGASCRRLPSKQSNWFSRLLQGSLRRRRQPYIPYIPYVLFTVELGPQGQWRCHYTDTSGRSGPSPLRGSVQSDFDVYSPSVIPGSPEERPEPQLNVSKWSVTLDNGPQVEMIGVCADQGSTWWGPDGSVLDNWPGFMGRDSGYNRNMIDLISSRSKIRNVPRPSRFGRPQNEGRCTVLLRVSSSIGFGNRSGFSSRGMTSVHYGQSPLINRFGQGLFSGQYITLEFDSTNQDMVTHSLGLHVPTDPEARPQVLASKRRPRGSIAAARGRAQRGDSRIPPSTAQPTTRPESSVNLHLHWIRLENISLQLGQKADFEMILSEDAADVPSTSRIQVRP